MIYYIPIVLFYIMPLMVLMLFAVKGEGEDSNRKILMIISAIPVINLLVLVFIRRVEEDN